MPAELKGWTMIESNNPHVNVDELMAKVRHEIAQRKQPDGLPLSLPNEHSAPDPEPVQDPSQVPDWSAFRTCLQSPFHAAEHYVEVGSFVPSWDQYGWLRRTASRLAARIVLFFSSFLTNWQTEFNRAIV